MVIYITSYIYSRKDVWRGRPWAFGGSGVGRRLTPRCGAVRGLLTTVCESPRQAKVAGERRRRDRAAIAVAWAARANCPPFSDAHDLATRTRLRRMSPAAASVRRATFAQSRAITFRGVGTACVPLPDCAVHGRGRTCRSLRTPFGMLANRPTVAGGPQRAFGGPPPRLPERTTMPGSLSLRHVPSGGACCSPHDTTHSRTDRAHCRRSSSCAPSRSSAVA